MIDFLNSPKENHSIWQLGDVPREALANHPWAVAATLCGGAKFAPLIAQLGVSVDPTALLHHRRRRATGVNSELALRVTS